MVDAMPARPPDSEVGDAELLRRMRAGDDAAYEALVRAHYNRLLHTARRILHREEDACDAVQDAFISAFKGIESFKGDSQLHTWLHRILVNAALGRLRVLQRTPEKSIEELLPHFGEEEHHLEPPVLWNNLPESPLQIRETRALVQRCISELPDTYRIVLLLRDVEGLDTEETASMIGTSSGVVKTRLHRARQALRSLLDPHFRKGDV